MLHLAFVSCALVLSVNGLMSCPERTPQENFDVSRFAGTWYEIKSASNSSLVEAVKCVRKVTSEAADGGLTIVGVYYSPVSSKYIEYRRELSRPAGSTSGYFTSKTPGSGSDLTVLGTDYSTYVVISSCWQKNGTYVERLRLASPTKTLSSEAETTVNQLLPYVTWTTTDQDCVEYSIDDKHTL